MFQKTAFEQLKAEAKASEVVKKVERKSERKGEGKEAKAAAPAPAPADAAVTFRALKMKTHCETRSGCLRALRC
jgi:hypothetical protein